MKIAQRPELSKKTITIGIIILIGIACTYAGDYFKPKIDLNVSAEAAKAMQQQIDCSRNTTNKYLQPSLALSQSEIELQKAGKSTISVILAERRLKEEECIQQATCEYIETNKQYNQMMFDVEFNSCLVDYKEDDVDPPSPD